MKKQIALPYSMEEAREIVYSYLQANGMYPLDASYGHFTSYSRGYGFDDPRRWKIDILVEYQSTDRDASILNITLNVVSPTLLQASFIFNSSDKTYYEGLIGHFECALRERSVETYRAKEVKRTFSPGKEVLYYLAVLTALASLVVFSAHHTWDDTFRWIIWPGILSLAFGYLIYKDVRFRQRKIKL